MKEFYRDPKGFLMIYEGDSLQAEEVVPVKSVQLITLTPIALKNIGEHYPALWTKHLATDKKNYKNLAWNEFTQNWITLMDKLLKDEGHFFVGCWEAEVAVISAVMKTTGYDLVESLVFDLAKFQNHPDLEKADGGPSAYKQKNDYYLLFNKTGVKTDIDMNKIDYPKQLLREVVKVITQKDDVILQPFGNTSKIAVIAPALFRKCICISTDPYWCQVALERATDEIKDRYWSRNLM